MNNVAVLMDFFACVCLTVYEQCGGIDGVFPSVCLTVYEQCGGIDGVFPCV